MAILLAAVAISAAAISAAVSSAARATTVTAALAISSWCGRYGGNTRDTRRAVESVTPCAGGPVLYCIAARAMQ